MKQLCVLIAPQVSSQHLVPLKMVLLIISCDFLMQYSESEGGRHSRSSKLHRTVSYQSNGEMRGAHNMTNAVNGKLSLEPPGKKMRLGGVHSQIKGKHPQRQHKISLAQCQSQCQILACCLAYSSISLILLVCVLLLPAWKCKGLKGFHNILDSFLRS